MDLFGNLLKSLKILAIRGDDGTCLLDIMVIVLGGLLCGAEDWQSVSAFGRAKEQWFKSFLALPHGIPSQYTFQRVFAAMCPEALERCFSEWIKALSGPTDGRLVAIDGKTLRYSFDQAAKKAAVHMVSAWDSNNELVFGQLATDAKSNEITTIPRLLELLELHGSTVTIDAIGCQKEIARQITEQEGGYVLSLKRNQPKMHGEVKLFLDEAIAKGFKDIGHDYHEQTEGDHGRIETRRTWVTPDVDWFEDRQQWAGLTSFAAVECERTVGNKTTCERRYFISSLDGKNAPAMAHAVGSHWGVENKLHWVLDVSFAEDISRVRKGHAAENLSRLRRMALNLLKREKTERLGIKNKRLLAGWGHDYLLKLLTG